MSLSFSLAAKPSIHRSNRKPCCSRNDVIRSEVTLAPKQRTESMFPLLSKQGVSLADLHVQEVVERQCQTSNFDTLSPCSKPKFEPNFLMDSYEMCRKICAEYAKTFYLGANSTFILVEHSRFLKFTS